jgi:hypothetical protein
VIIGVTDDCFLTALRKDKNREERSDCLSMIVRFDRCLFHFSFLSEHEDTRVEIFLADRVMRSHINLSNLGKKGD